MATGIRVTKMTPEQVAEALKKQVVRKVCVTKWRGHTYYVQEMPGMWRCGRDFAIMKDRKKWYINRYKTEKEAVSFMLRAILRELDQQEMEF